MTRRAYDHPADYERALAPFRDLRREMDFFEKAISRFSRVPVRTLLEVACGSCAHLPEAARRGYRYVGLDRNPRMLAHAAARAAALDTDFRGVRADLRRFHLRPKADFAFVLFGSLYRSSNAELRRHLECMARSLKPGGLYVLHMVVEGHPDHIARAWREDVRVDGIAIRVEYERRLLDWSRQLREETLRLTLREGRRTRQIVERNLDKFILPQEFLLLLEPTPFHLVGWYDGFRIGRPFDGRKAANYVVAVLRNA